MPRLVLQLRVAVHVLLLQIYSYFGTGKLSNL